MSKRIPAKSKAELGKRLAEWYRNFGQVTPRRPYHEDDGEQGEGSAKPIFEGHPYLKDMPIGASSDLASAIINNPRTLDEANKRSEELTQELQNKLALRLGQKQQKRFTYQPLAKPQPY